MKNRFKTIMSIIMTFTILTALIPVTASAGVVMAEHVSGWNFSGQADAYGCLDYETKYSGDCSYKMTSNSPQQSNIYGRLTSDAIAVKRGKTYRYRFMAKSKQSKRIFVAIDWGTYNYLTPIGGTYDWMPFSFEYTHETSNPSVVLGFFVDSTSKGLWIDNVEMYELDENGNEIGSNLIVNPGFDGRAVVSSTATGDGENDITKKVNAVQNAEKYFNNSDYMGALGEFSCFPINQTKEITVDGNEDEWSDIPAMEIREGLSTISDYTKDGNPKDLQASVKTMHDEEYLYLLCKVTDDVHHNPNNNINYWQGDSIQLCVADVEQLFATEVGFMYDTVTQTVPFFGFTENDNVLSKAVIEGESITYEIAIPWTFKWESRPEEFLFNIGFNDNDGTQRRYGMELTYGICEGAKATGKFQTARPISEADEFLAWIEGDKEQYLDKDGIFTVYLVNLGEKRDFDITIQPGEKNVSDTVEQGKGMKYNINIPMTSMDISDVSVTVNGKIFKKSVNVNPTAETYKPNQEKLKNQIAETEKLLSECKNKSIPVSYEEAGLAVMKHFDEMIQKDIDNSYYKMMDYTFDKLDKIYDEIKTSMEKYLSGEKEALSVPKYVTGKLTYDGPIVYGNTKDESGNEEVRPLFFIGYGHFGTARNYIPLYNSIGFNVNQSEVPMSQVIQRGSNFDGWIVGNSAKADVSLIKTEDTKSGYALRIVNPTALANNISYIINQYIAVHPNSTYEISFKAKATNCGRAWASFNGYDNRFQFGGNYDWTDYSFTYTTGETTTQRLMLCCEDKTTELLIGDLCVKEVGSDENIVENADFSIYHEEAPLYDTSTGNIGWVKNYLEIAQENNVSVTLLLSPHYFPDFVKEACPDVNYPGPSFLKFNIMHDVALSMAKDFYRTVAGMIKKYDLKCVNSIVISNEWEFETSLLPEFYQPWWEEYLKNKYSDVSEMNGIYKTDYTSFGEVPMALEENPFAYYDYIDFNEDVTTEWHRIMTEIINEILPDIPVSAKVKVGGLFKYGTNFEKLNEFFTMNGNDASNYITNGDKYIKKMMDYDYQTSITDMVVNNAEDHVIHDGWRYVRDTEYDSVYEGPYLSPEQTKFVDTDMWQGAIHKRGFSAIWLWDKSYNEQDDRFGSINIRPDTFYQTGKVSLDLNRLSREIAAIENAGSEVAIFDSTLSEIYSPEGAAVQYNAYSACVYNGKKVRFVTDNSVSKMHEKILVIPGYELVSDKALGNILDYKANGGKIIILGSDSVRVNENNQNIAEEKRNKFFDGSYVIDLSIYTEQSEDLAVKFGEIFSSENMQLIRIIDTATGDHVKNVEYEYGIYNGNIILNLCNWEMEKPKNVRIFAGDREITNYKELRSNREMEGILTLEGYTPVLLSFNAYGLFFDMVGHWAECTVSELARRGVVNGRTETTYVPEANVTRAEFLKLILSADGKIQTDYLGGIGDVFADNWYAGYVQTAKNMGIIKPLLNGAYFEPDRAITREEMALLTVLVYEAEHGVITAGENSFSDASENEIINKAAAIGILSGYEDNTVRPQNNLTRAEAAKVIVNYMN